MDKEQRQVLSEMEISILSLLEGADEENMLLWGKEAAAIHAALADSDALAVERQKTRWLGLVCEAQNNGYFVASNGGRTVVYPEYGAPVLEWTGDVASGYPHFDALAAALKGNQ